MRAPERRFVGFVAKYMGDGVLVYFGYPQALKDDDGLEPDELKLVIEVVDNRVEHLESGTTLHRLLRQFRNLPVGRSPDRCP
jgi:class 3 adenylate cyclase